VQRYRRCERCKRNVAQFELEQTREKTYIVLGNAFPVRCIAEEVCPRDILMISPVVLFVNNNIRWSRNLSTQIIYSLMKNLHSMMWEIKPDTAESCRFDL